MMKGHAFAWAGAALLASGPAGGQAVAPAAALCSTVAPSAGGTTSGNVAAGPVTFVNGWASAGKTTFSHVIAGPPGPVRLTLETCSSATGGETVAIYPATASGERMPRRPRVMFSIAVPRGNVRTATMTIPAARRGERHGAAHVAVVVENAGGKLHRGAYRLTVSR